MRHKTLALALTLGLGCPSAMQGQQVLEPPNWDRSLALLSAQEADSSGRLRTLFDLARAGDSRATLASLIEIAHEARLSMPAREQLLFRFAVGLGDLAPASVDRTVLDYLLVYKPRTLVPDDDRVNAGVPLFNIRAATSGAMNRWSRELASNDARLLLEEAPEVWLRAYLSADSLQRRGFEDTLDLASDAHLEAIKPVALAQLAAQPALTAVAGKAALYTHDVTGLQQVLVFGRGAAIAGLLAASAKSLSTEDSFALMRAAIQSAPAGNGALAIAQLTPVLGDHAGARTLLMDTLLDNELGSAAALALARNPTPETTAALTDLARDSDKLASRRAAMALSVSDAASSRGRER